MEAYQRIMVEGNDGGGQGEEEKVYKTPNVTTDSIVTRPRADDGSGKP